MRSATDSPRRCSVNLAREWCQVAASWQYDEQNQKIFAGPATWRYWLTAEGMTAGDKSLNESSVWSSADLMVRSAQGRNPVRLLDDMKIYDKRFLRLHFRQRATKIGRSES